MPDQTQRPDRDLLDRVRAAIADPGAVVSRDHGDDQQSAESLSSWSARAVMTAVIAPLRDEVRYRRAGWDTATRELVEARAERDSMVRDLGDAVYPPGSTQGPVTIEWNHLLEQVRKLSATDLGPAATPDRHEVEVTEDPEEPGWYIATCSACDWTTNGKESVVEDAADQHFTENLIPDRRHVPSLPSRAHAHGEVPRG